MLDITEGKKHDKVVIDKNKLYMNNKEVKIKQKVQTEPMAAHRMYWSKNCPYGKSSSYTKIRGTIKKKLTLSKPIADATVGAIIALICMGLSLSGGAGAVIGFIASAVISWFNRNSPEAKAWSIKDSVKVHKTKGLNVSSHMSVQKHCFTYYANTNFTGKIGSGSRFKIFSY